MYELWALTPKISSNTSKMRMKDSKIDQPTSMQRMEGETQWMRNVNLFLQGMVTDNTPEKAKTQDPE